MAISTRRTNSCFACQKAFIPNVVDETPCQPALGLPDPVGLYSRRACFKCHASWVGPCSLFRAYSDSVLVPSPMKRAYPSPRRSEAVSERLRAASGVLFAEALRASTNPLVAHLRSIGMVLPLERQRLIARQPGLAEASSLSSVQNPPVPPQNPSNPLCRGAKAIYELSHPFGHQRVYVALCVLPLSAVGQILRLSRLRRRYGDLVAKNHTVDCARDNPKIEPKGRVVHIPVVELAFLFSCRGVLRRGFEPNR